ncbi:hypothetical protein G4Y79_03040 [Phototrophicus methaneseepsis]|uniref:Uncharacterized protein n=1 Tax=Phototrophicus methaneseepsis TaxID=2710758 RepID=A0A7S8IF97_9CHLR|nr:hypothetical protein [Phototrophicus methaneseepsis]QPC83371.1 hypothetical protein G4Y79_03040 [Phototrophicus methaneseepsis]
MVQLEEPRWTTQALHLASALARHTRSRIVLLSLNLARNPGLLGSEVATPPLSSQQCAQIYEYSLICEDYGVDCSLHQMQYVTYRAALQQVRVNLNACAIFAKKPDSRYGWWNQMNAWWLMKAVQTADCPLYLVDETTRSIDWVPARVKVPEAAHTAEKPSPVEVP